MEYINFAIFCQIYRVAWPQPRVSQMFPPREENYPTLAFMLTVAAASPTPTTTYVSATVENSPPENLLLQQLAPTWRRLDVTDRDDASDELVIKHVYVIP